MLSVISMSSKTALTQAAKKEKMKHIYVGRGRKRLVVNRSTFDAFFAICKNISVFQLATFHCETFSYTPVHDGQDILLFIPLVSLIRTPFVVQWARLNLIFKLSDCTLLSQLHGSLVDL